MIISAWLGGSGEVITVGDDGSTSVVDVVAASVHVDEEVMMDGTGWSSIESGVIVLMGIYLRL